MDRFIDLCGDWTLLGSDENGAPIAIDATVPGCVHTDLIKSGIIKDIYYRDNFRDIQWIEACDFTYKKTFWAEDVKENAYLEFEGLDTYCDVYLNGKLVGSADDMFIPFGFFINGALNIGENILEVRFRSPIREVEGRPVRNGAFTTERLYTRRMQCTYSWDWVERFVTMGIYRPVRIAFRERNEIADIYVYTNDITPYSAQLKLEVDLRDFEQCGDELYIEIKAPDGCVVFSKSRTILQSSIYEYIDIRDPKLWYPVGYGDQPLYTLTVTTPSSCRKEKVGIRKITVLQLEDEERSREREICRWLQSKECFAQRDHNESTAGFCVIVNGVRIMCKGGNWVPCEPFPSAETPEKITRLLELGVAAGVNMVRVWGGGIFERDEFYNECDRLGILVTQDFLMACGDYPDEEQWFIDALNREAETAVLRLRNHACLAFWSGDNENAEFGDENSTDFLGYRSATYGLEPIVTSLDPNRRFFPSSPYGGNKYSSVTRGTTHNTNYMWPTFDYIINSDMSDYREFFSMFISRFCVEQAAFGMSFVSCLEKFLTEEDIFGESTEFLQYHMKNNPHLETSLFEISEIMASKIFGDFRNGADRVRKLQLLHCEWTRISFELYRRYKGFAWGLVYWMLNDCWPASSGWAFLDYYACPKPAYYTFKRCASPVIATVSAENGILSVHISNDLLSEQIGSARLYIYDTATGAENEIARLSYSVDANVAQKVFQCGYGDVAKDMSESCVIICDIITESESDRALFIPKRYSDLSIAYDGYRVTEETEDSITVVADSFTPFALLDSPYLLEDNCFILKKGEKRTVKKIMKL